MSDIRHLDIKQLRILHLLLLHHNVSRVAAIMGLTQQAVSGQLKKLRAVFNDRLFIRQSNGLIPTPFARTLAPQISDILARLEKLVEPKTFDPQTIDSQFTICATDYAQAVILPALLSKLRTAAPNLKVIVRDIEIDNLSQHLDNGDIDLVLSFPDFVPARYPAKTLYTETHKCVISKNHTRATEHWSIEEIARHPQLIISPKRANLVGSADQYFAAFGLGRNIVMTLPFFAAAPDCIATTDLLALLPSKLLPHEKLSEIKHSLNLPTFEVILAWHQRCEQDPLNLWVRQLLLEAYE